MIGFAPMGSDDHEEAIPIAFKLRGMNDGKFSVRLSLVHPKFQDIRRARVFRSRIQAESEKAMRAVRRIKGL